MTAAATMYWPRSRAAEGLELLARAARLPLGREPKSIRADHVPSAATALGLEVEEIESSFSEIKTLLGSAGPAVLRITDDELVMLVRSRRGRITIVRPDHHVVTVPIEVVHRAFVDPLAAPL